MARPRRAPAAVVGRHGAAGGRACCVAEHDGRRGAQDPEASYDVEVVLGVDLDVRDARGGRGDVAEDPAGGPAGRAERRGELEQRRLLAELVGPRGVLEHGGLRRSAAGAASAPWTRWVPRKRPSVSARKGPNARAAADRDDEDADTCAHVGPNDRRRAKGFPSPAGERRQELHRRPGLDAQTEAGSSVVTGRSPTIIEQQESTSAKRGESAWAARARATSSASGTGPVDLEASESVPAAARAEAQ